MVRRMLIAIAVLLASIAGLLHLLGSGLLGERPDPREPLTTPVPQQVIADLRSLRRRLFLR